MKGWQDRGEVLDSDDEESSLDVEVQRPAKRVRVGDGTAEHDEAEDGGITTIHDTLQSQSAETNEDGNEEWLQRKPGVTYGRKTAPLATQRATESSNLSLSVGFDTADVNAASDKPLSSYRDQVDALPEDANRSSSQPSSDSEGLPEVHELLAPDNAGQAEEQRYPLLSIPSSPLSERAVSPTPPLLADVFHFSPPALPVSASSARPASVAPNDAADVAYGALEVYTFAEPRRRNFRTRNEKQLHPYMFDKAQYQQQCRERGMRPVRLTDAAQQPAETQQDSSDEDNDQSSQILFANSNSSPRNGSPAVKGRPRNAIDDSSRLHPRRDVNDYESEDELPDLPAIMRRPILDGIQQGAKRRRLFDNTRHRSANLAHPDRSGDHDDFSIPPSPPPTSSDENDHRVIEAEIPKFRLPRGLTPRNSLPTPRVSSEQKPIHNGDGSETSGEELPLRRSGLPTSSRKAIAVLSSSASSEAEEEEPAFYESRLHRERRRIKGVLPASWLKIDFRAQQKPQSPRKARFLRADSSSPERMSPQKGVAQRVTSRRSASPDRPAIIDISDDESDAALQSLLHSLSPPRIRQSRLEFKPSQQRRAQPSFDDVDDMEVDWVDPMLGGTSSNRNSRSSKKRQPKIGDAFKAAPKRTVDMSEERDGLRAMIGSARSRHRSNKKPRKSRKQHTQAPRLSILDAPSPAAGPAFRLPQFVRVAKRQAGKRSDNARHSPSNKHVRLATRGDTEGVEAVLKAWREGTIQPRQTTVQNRHLWLDSASVEGPDYRKRTTQPRQIMLHNQRIELESAQAEHSDHQDASVQQPRTPLTELSRNVPWRNLFELREKTNRSQLRHVRITQAPRVQQTWLRAEVLERFQPSPEQDEPEVAAPRVSKPRQIRPHSSRAQYRGAQLESLESEFDQSHRAAAFERRMQMLTESVVRRGKTPHGEQLERFLYGSTPAPVVVADPVCPDMSSLASAIEAHATHPDMSMRKNLEVPGPKEVLPYRHRKRLAHRIDAEAREYRQPSEPLPDVVDVDQLPDNLPREPAPTLQGLGPFGTRYATDFDILPLAVGTYFHQSSFIGSGDFAAALNFAGRDLDKSTGRLSIHVNEDVLEWGWWTEEVASGLARIPRAVSKAFESLQVDGDPVDVDLRCLVLSNVDYLLRSVTRYFARCLAFLDPMDRKSCIECIHAFVEDLIEQLDEFATAVKTDHEIRGRCLYFALVIAKQAQLLSDHRSVCSDTRSKSHKLVERAAHRLAANVFPRAFSSLRTFYDDNRHASKREAGIRDDNVSVTSMVVLHHVLNKPGVRPSPFWNVIFQQLNMNASAFVSVPQFDKVWYDIFTLLPVLEIDANGIAQIGSRLHGSQEDWSLPRMLTERLFGLYDASSQISGSTINEYVRAIVTRCYGLVSRWGWWRCEAVLGIIFDFFARRGLAQLHKEDSRGSPRFLEELNDVPSLEIQAGEPAFHIFLKFLAASLIGMRQHGVHADKKIGGIAWRFIPNHGRTYRKDTEVKRQDLDALRNHHDLLSTLYYATPSKNRLRVDLLRNLVDHSVSHREACRLSVRAWANLAALQTSTSEEDENLDPFVEWYREILSTTKTQYRQAKNEVEQDVESARAGGEFPVPQHVIDDTIARNQRQISATLVDLLVAVKRALKSASSTQRTTYLLKGCAFWDVLELYDPSSRRLNSVLDETLTVVQAALQTLESFSPAAESQSSSDESQDYGGSSALLEFASSEPRLQKDCESATHLLHDPVNQLLSNLFGADAAVDDVLLTKAVDTWVQLAQWKVRSGESSWTSYVNGYTSASWNQLRDTAHRRKFTPYFLSRMANLIRYPNAGVEILGPWLESLVEREALLSFQHTFTSNLVSLYPSAPLLSDLPIDHNGTGAISLHDFKMRRLILIAKIFSNMRDRLDTLAIQDPSEFEPLRREYAILLKKVMDAMKARYQHLNGSNNSNVANDQEQGSYVTFVHHIIALMQENTTEICPIYSFFTDSNAFPLPTSDPTYVVGRLKAYAPKLDMPGQRKQLGTFIRTLSDRAAREQQQYYLVEQLADAMLIEAQQDQAHALRLPHVLMTAIFPAYIDQALSTPCLWIISRPVLQACGTAIEALLYRIHYQDRTSLVIAAEIIMTFFRSMIMTMDYALADTSMMDSSQAYALFSSLFDAAQRCLTMARHLCKMFMEDSGLKQMLGLFDKYAGEVEAAILSGSSVFEPQRHSDEIPRFQFGWQDTLEHTREVALGTSFRNDWYTEGGRFFLRKWGGRDEVIPALGDKADEKMKVLEAIGSCRKSYSTIFGGAEIRLRAAFGVASGLVIL